MRRQRLEFKDFWNEYRYSFTNILGWGWGIIFVLFSSLTILAFFLPPPSYGTERNIRMFYGVLFEGASPRDTSLTSPQLKKFLIVPENRKLFLRILSLIPQGGSDEKILKFFHEERERITHKEEGIVEMPSVIPRDETREEVIASFWKVAGVLSLLFTPIGLLFAYTTRTDYGTRVIDLPWKKPWVWLFLLLTLPFCIPVFLISLIRWRRFIARHPEYVIHVAEDQRRRDEQERLRLEQDRVARRDAEVVPYRFTGASNNMSFREMWIDLRGSSRNVRLKAELENEQAKVQTIRERLSEEGGHIRDLQTELASSMHTIRDLEASVQNIVIAESELSRYNEEFDRLLILPDVEYVRMTHQAIEVWTKRIIFTENRYLAQKRSFDLGDYHVLIQLDIDRYFIRCIRSGRHDEVLGHKYGGGIEGSFCFGTRGGRIETYIKSGEYLSAIALMIEGLHHINPEDTMNLASIFKEVGV